MHSILYAPNKTAPNPVPVKMIEFVINFILGKKLWHYLSTVRKISPALKPKKTL